MSKENFTRENVASLILQGHIAPEQIEETLKITGISPSSQSWRTFLDALVLWLGILALALSLMFFVAFNWSELGRFAQFALVEAAIVAAMFSYYKADKESLRSTASLLLASLFVGVLLALYGQTYQTGADTWQLFFSWALLILPWSLLSKYPAQWVLLIALLNLSIPFYIESHTLLFFSSNSFLLWILFAFNLLVLVLWEWNNHRIRNNNPHTWYIRLVVLASGFPLTTLMFLAILNKEDVLATFVVWVLYLSAIYLMYRRNKPDLFKLAWGCLSGIVIVMTFLVKNIEHTDSFVTAYFLILAFAIIALGTGSAYWLKHLHEEFTHA